MTALAPQVRETAHVPFRQALRKPGSSLAADAWPMRREVEASLQQASHHVNLAGPRGPEDLDRTAAVAKVGTGRARRACIGSQPPAFLMLKLAPCANPRVLGGDRRRDLIREPLILALTKQFVGPGLATRERAGRAHCRRIAKCNAHLGLRGIVRDSHRDVRESYPLIVGWSQTRSVDRAPDET